MQDLIFLTQMKITIVKYFENNLKNTDRDRSVTACLTQSKSNL